MRHNVEQLPRFGLELMLAARRREQASLVGGRKEGSVQGRGEKGLTGRQHGEKSVGEGVLGATSHGEHGPLGEQSRHHGWKGLLGNEKPWLARDEKEFGSALFEVGLAGRLMRLRAV